MMFNITNHLRNENQKPLWDITSQLSEWLLPKCLQIANVGQDVEKREPQYTVGGNVNWCSYYGKQYWRFLNKLKMELPYHPVIPLFGINLRKMKSLIWKDNMHPNAHSSIIYNRQDMEAINVSINRWIDKEDYYTHKHTHTKWITQPKRRMKICHLQQHRWT